MIFVILVSLGKIPGPWSGVNKNNNSDNVQTERVLLLDFENVD
jgi:hypothetical protein